jgi:Mg-chelatase subunit ChlD
MPLKALLICAALLGMGPVAANEEAAHEQPAASQGQAPDSAPATHEHIRAAESPAPDGATAVPPPVPQAAAHEAPGYAVRIVIDTSGSMKQTDPKNLRVPALKLLVNLLPAGSEAGVWLFDSKPEELVPAGPVDSEWKMQATQAANRIHSKGAFTNIEAALSAAAADWLPPAEPGPRRRLILLTDGMVDVSKNPEESAASREALLNRLTPALQQAGIEVYTIALSSQADEALLQQLTLASGGWNVVAMDAEQLQRSFLQLFNQSVPHDSVPIHDNEFTLDAGVHEFTLLVLLQEGATPTRLIAPDGQVLTQNSKDSQLRWLHQGSFDLVTISDPKPGLWKLEAKQDPANQVMVVSDLAMEPMRIESYLQAGDQPRIGVVFKEKDQPIRREDFLGLLVVKAILQGPLGPLDLSLAQVPDQPGAFAAPVEQPLLPGDYSVTIQADGKTFQRETRQNFRVMANFLKVEQHADEGADHAGTTILLTPNPQSLASDALTIHATVTDQAQQTRELTAEPGDNAWQLKLPSPGPGDQWIVNIQASGKTPEGAPITVPLKPITLTGRQPEPPAPEPIPPSPQAPAAPAPEWGTAAAIAIAVNLGLILSGYGIARLLKKRRDAAIALLLDKFSAAPPS